MGIKPAKNHYTQIFTKVKQDYNRIAAHFSQKRSYLWEEIEPYLEYVKKGDRILDAGCGNGRLYQALDEKRNGNYKLNYLGIDFSKELIKIARQKYPQAEFKQADLNKSETFNNLNNFDLVFCLAVLHHFPTPESQLKLLKNLNKTLKINGKLILTVWNLWQKKYQRLHFDQLIWKIKKRNIKWLKVPYKISDGRTAEVKAERFCYCFTKKELADLTKKAGFNIIKQTQGKNLCLAAKK